MSMLRAGFIAAIILYAAVPGARAATSVVIVEGLGGNDRYTTEFAAQTADIEAAARTLRPAPEIRIFRDTQATREDILAYLEQLGLRAGATDLLLIYLVGHGSFDEHDYKFNLPGPDLSDSDLLDAFGAFGNRNVVVINTSSASGAAHDRWQGDSRVVITATRSGVERHATRFGTYFAAALSDPGADVDKNDRVSAQEAFDYASREVTAYFESSGQLATEHARISGAAAGRIALALLGAPRTARGDPAPGPLLRRRDELAGQVDALRLARDEMPAERYQQELLQLMLELAEIEERIEQAEADGPPR
ncbi:MAG: hypothetical protein OEW35_02675 [Gammaproteobacteria bacterium]|nr:hypothetical protein [Gammaproteobacteria bacterium]MDH4254605.1 hypothetical protein [Gammaproteobacteria bacterium]MDH5310985.1 hypothetical protein [Gammaproteobacteria bacterium]